MSQKVRIVTEGGFFDLDKPDDFMMGAFIASIRAAGYFMNDTLYQPAERIVTIFLFDSDAPEQAPVKPRGEGTILQ